MKTDGKHSGEPKAVGNNKKIEKRYISVKSGFGVPVINGDNTLGNIIKYKINGKEQRPENMPVFYADFLYCHEKISFFAVLV